MQAADASKPPMPFAVGKKTYEYCNTRDSCGMHGMLALHVGMHIRLLHARDEKKTLVKDAEGEIVRIKPHADDQVAVKEF